MDYIRKAVKLQARRRLLSSTASAGPITGSAAMPAAVEHLERAVELKPDDPIINDHLGDAYWRVGRKIEANYQWQQALRSSPRRTILTQQAKIVGGTAGNRRDQIGARPHHPAGQKSPQ